MRLRRNLLARSRLYLILDKAICGKRPLNRSARLFSRAGVEIIQLRDKAACSELLTAEATGIARSLKNTNTLFIVNDDVYAAKFSGADGVHLGQRDTSVKVARRILGKSKIIGKSCGSLLQARAAQAQGADYLGIGPVFPSLLKPGTKALGLNSVSRLKGKMRIPYYAIGNINLSNLGKVLKTGVSGVALCRAILNAKDAQSAATKFKRKLKQE